MRSLKEQVKFSAFSLEFQKFFSITRTILGFRNMQEKLKKCFGLIVVLVSTIHKARSIRTIAKCPFKNNVVSKLAIFDPHPLILAGVRSLCTNSSFGLHLSTIQTTSFMDGP